MKSILMKLFIIGLCVSFFPIQAIAGGSSGFNKILWLYQRNCNESRGFEVRLTEPHLNPDGCITDNVLEVKCGTEAYRSAVAMFLTAFSGDYTVQTWVNGCDGEGHAIVKAVRIQK